MDDTMTRLGDPTGVAPRPLQRVGAFLASARGGFLLGCLASGVLITMLRRKPAAPCDG